MKHYNSDYLNSTAEKLADLKKRSFAHFLPFENKNILDIGCGNGIDLLQFSKLSNPNNSLIGVDHDEKFIELANSNADKIPNLVFKTMDVYNLNFETESIDGLRNERLIQHLKEPQKAFQEMHRVLKKNAPIVILETDWKGLSMFTGLDQIETKISNYLVYQKINNGLATRHIPSYLNDLNFNKISIDVTSNTINSLEEANTFIMFELILKEMLENGSLEVYEYEQFQARVKHLDKEGSFRILMSLILYSAFK